MYYVCDGLDVVAEFDSGFKLLARYGHGPQVDQPLWMSRANADGTAGEDIYLQADHQGSVTLATGSNGGVRNAYGYDAYGNYTLNSETVSQPYGYTGRVYDEVHEAKRNRREDEGRLDKR